MRVEYSLILDDFEREISAISELADATRIGSDFSARARVSLANSLTLVLASVFEEYVRQLVRAVWLERVKNANDLSSFPPKLRSRLWRSTLERAARQPFSNVDESPRVARDRLQNLLKFCLEGDISAEIASEISHNDNNMRPDQINTLFNQIGVKNVLAEGCEFEEVLEFYASEKAGQAVQNLKSDIEDFFTRRNTIAHAIAFGSSGGADSIHRDIEVFRLCAKALAVGADRFVEP